MGRLRSRLRGPVSAHASGFADTAPINGPTLRPCWRGQPEFPHLQEYHCFIIVDAQWQLIPPAGFGIFKQTNKANLYFP
jgi:hypothetical protein